MRRLIGVLCWALVFWLAGCATLGVPVAPRSGQEQAVWIAWKSYGRDDTPPLVRWVEGAALSCTDPQSNKPGFPILGYDDQKGTVGEQCREGDTWSPLEVLVAWHGELSFSETALAHELEHAELLRRGIWLGHHQRPDFQARIDVANEAIRSAGR